jgi:hypothetical protein
VAGGSRVGPPGEGQTCKKANSEKQVSLLPRISSRPIETGADFCHGGDSVTVGLLATRAAASEWKRLGSLADDMPAEATQLSVESCFDAADGQSDEFALALSSLKAGKHRRRKTVDSGTVPSGHPGVQQSPSRSSSSDQQAVAPLTKGDLAIVLFVSSLWLWAAVWAITSHAFR